MLLVTEQGLRQPAKPPAGPAFNARRCLKILRAPQFGREMTHLLRRPMSSRTTFLDAGVMCRDSALLLALIAGRLGLASEICEGRLELIGPLQTGQLGEMKFETHAWIDIEGVGLCDFSPDLTPGGGLGWKPWPAQYLIGSRYHPTKAHFLGEYFRNEAQFHARKSDALKAEPGFSTLYLEERRRRFDAALYHDAVNFTNSYLMSDLTKQPFFDRNILARAALHLWDLSKGRSPSLTDRPQMDAWRTIAAKYEGASERYRDQVLNRIA